MAVMKNSAEHPAGISRRGTRSALSMTLVVLMGLTTTLSGCTGQDATEWLASESPAGAAAASASSVANDSAQTQVHVDSILPIPVLLERFRSNIPRVDTLSFASASREALVQRFANALAAGDTSELRLMTMTQAEFAWLYYPESEFTRPPYELAPEHVFLLIDQNSQKGLLRMVRRSVGLSMEYAGHDCPAEPRARERDRLWERCNVQLRNPNGTVDSLRLFGAIWERDGRFKLVSFANEL